MSTAIRRRSADAGMCEVIASILPRPSLADESCDGGGGFAELLFGLGAACPSGINNAVRKVVIQQAERHLLDVRDALRRAGRLADLARRAGIVGLIAAANDEQGGDERSAQPQVSHLPDRSRTAC